MSYRRTFRKNITVYYSGSTSYPASQNGGTTSYSGSTTETIEFDVYVDTDPFDDSVDDMKQHVDVLTGSVVTMEAAQVATIHESSKRISKTIVDGFFKTVRSDISQQIVQLQTKADSLLVQLHEIAKRCADKQRVMTVDYQRISSRYAKIFEELNKELENRIFSLDEPIFRISEKMGGVDDEIARQVSVPAIHSGENMRLHTKIGMAHAKNQAVDTIDRAKKYLEVQYRTDYILNRSLKQGGEPEVFNVPYVVMEAADGRGATRTELYRPQMLNAVNENVLVEGATRKEPGEFPGNDPRVADYFKAQLAERLAADTSEHNKRVAQMTDRLFKNNC